MEIRNATVEGTKRELIIGWRLGLYDVDPDSNRSAVRHVGRLYRWDDDDDILLIRETIAEFNELAAKSPGYSLCLSAFPVYQESPTVFDGCLTD